MIDPDVSVLLVSWNTHEETRACLEALPAAAGGTVRYEVIAVDNASADGSADLLASWPDLFLVQNQQNKGYAAAVNQAYACALGQHVLLLGTDVRLRPGALGALLDFLRIQPDVAGIAPRYVDPDGKPAADQHHRALPTLRSALAATTALGRWAPFRRAHAAHVMAGADLSQPTRVGQPSTSCLLLARSELAEKKILDERLPLYGSASVLAHAFAGTGRELWMTPQAEAVHRHGASTRQLGNRVDSQARLAGLAGALLLTQPRYKVVAFRLLVMLDHVIGRLRGHRGLPSVRALRAGLRGEMAPLPVTDARPWVVMSSSVAWSPGGQRQHCLASELAEGRRVLYVEPPEPSRSWRFAVRRVGPSVWHAVLPTLLPAGGRLAVANWLNRRFAARVLRGWLDRRPGPRVLWIDDDLAAPMVGRLAEDAVVYDGADLFWTFIERWTRWNRRQLRRNLRTAVRRADLVVTAAPTMAGLMPPSRRSPVVVPNGCDLARFAPDGSMAEWVQDIPGPRLCYTGRVDGRAFDLELLTAVALRRPDWAFLLCGSATRSVRTQLADLTNVHLLGGFGPDAVPGVLRACDVGLIPYRLGALSNYVQPGQPYEYLAVGKPVVATPLPALRELETDGLVYLAADPEGFEAAVEKALTSSLPSTIAARYAVAEQNSWSVRGARVRALLDELAGPNR